MPIAFSMRRTELLALHCGTERVWLARLYHTQDIPVYATLLSSPPVDWIPLVRELVAISVFILSLVLTTSLTLLVIAIAWIRYHPLYGLAILAGACAPFIIQRLFPPKQKDG